jgi:hypothetical protein
VRLRNDNDRVSEKNEMKITMMMISHNLIATFVTRKSRDLLFELTLYRNAIRYSCDLRYSSKKSLVVECKSLIKMKLCAKKESSVAYR